MCSVYFITGSGTTSLKKPIPVGEPFEWLEMDFKEMDVSEDGNRYTLVFQYLLSRTECPLQCPGAWLN